ncbi:hypothetical protein QBC45DRAFT_325818, partial [Copromyces sp. CBS 386.78]
NVIFVYDFDNYIIYILPGYKGFIYNSRIFNTLLGRGFLILLNFYYLAESRYNYLYKLFILYYSIPYYL